MILITDGAPQGKRDGENLTPEQIVQRARDSAADLKKGEDGIAGTADDVKVITIGLSLDKVPSGKKLLYDIADKDKNGNPMFFLAESASDLPNILRQIIDTIMDDAIVNADVTDTVGEAFYLVDKATGLPLGPNDMIDIEGRKVTDASQAAGIVQPDGATVKWLNQAVDQQNGWHGTVYVKAKEDLIGGNAVKTNGDASVEAQSYRMGDKTYEFNDSLIHDKLKSLKIDFETPRVNVNELTFSGADTEWTVYLGTKVDPKEQIRQLYEQLTVTEVVNEDGSLHYDIVPNSIVDDRTGREHGTVQKIALAPEILTAIKADPVLSSKYAAGDELNWDAFLTDILRPEGVTVPYHKYGVEGADSNIVIKLTKEILEGEEEDLVNKSPHATTVVNGEDGEGGSVPVEKYTLTVQYNPDYDHVLPAGQGGHGIYDFHTGTYGSMYQGHGAGRETSTNTHKINVFVKDLEVLKKDAMDEEQLLDTAKFKLYRPAKAGEEGAVTIQVNGADKSVVQVGAEMATENGRIQIEDLAFVSTDESAAEYTYYLVETKAPEGYLREEQPKVITLVLTDEYRDYEDPKPVITDISEKPYKWTQTASLRFQDGTVKTEFSADVLNNPGAILPSTGGPGTALFGLLGSLLIIIAAAGLVMGKKRRAERQ